MPPIVKDVTIRYHTETKELREADELFDKTNKKIRSQGEAAKETSEKVVKATGAMGTGFNKLNDNLASLGKTIIAVFAVERILAFANASIKAFQDAELTANKLRFAVEKIANGKDGAFDKLIEQSEKLQNISIFSDDDIQKAQTALIQFGLTTKQVEELIPKIIDLSSATGETLSQGVDRALGAINGMAKANKDLGINFKDTGSKTENLAVLMEKLEKVAGSTAVALETSSGQAHKMDNEINNLQESIGEKAAPIWQGFKVFVLEAAEAMLSLFSASTAVEDFAKKQKEQVESLSKSYDHFSDVDIERLKTLTKARLKEETEKLNSWTENDAKIAFLDDKSAQAKLMRDAKYDAEDLQAFIKVENDRQAAKMKSIKGQEKMEDDLTLGGEAARNQKILEMQKKNSDEKAKKDKEAIENQKQFDQLSLEIDEIMYAGKLMQANEFQDNLDQLQGAELQSLLDSGQINEVMMQEVLDKRQEFINESNDREVKLEQEKNERIKQEKLDLLEFEQEISDAELNIFMQGVKITQGLYKDDARIQRALLIFEKIVAIGKIIKDGAVERAKLALMYAGTPLLAPQIALSRLRTVGNVAAVVATTIPQLQLEKGAIDLKRGRAPMGRDTIPAMLNEGESVMTTEETRSHKDLFQSIRNKNFEDFINSKYVLPKLEMYFGKHHDDRTFDVNIDSEAIGRAARIKSVAVSNLGEVQKYIASEMMKQQMFKRNRIN